MSDQANIITPVFSRSQWILVLIITAAALLGHLGYLELSGEEPRRATVAWEMLESGEFLIPQAYGMEYYNKPPAYHWLLAIVMGIFGSSEFFVRLPGIISFLMMGWLIYRWVRHETNDPTATLAGLLFVFSADLFFYASVFPAEIDLTFSLILLANGICIYQIGLRGSGIKWYLLAYLLLSMAILMKGFLALHFHFLSIIGWLWYRGSMRKFWSSKHLCGVLLCAAILIGYYGFYAQSGNISYLFLNNFIESGDKVAAIGFMEILDQLISCPLSLLKISLPWSILLFVLFKKSNRDFVKTQPIYIFCIIYILCNIWIYWLFVDVRDRYLYPMVPYVCIILFGIIHQLKLWPSKRKSFIIVLFIMVGLRLVFNFIVMPRQDSNQWSDDYIYRELTDSLLHHTEGKPIDLFMSPDYEELPFELLGYSEVPKQPVIPYQIPYYLIRKTGHSPQNVDKIVPGKYYLVLDKTQFRETELLFDFVEPWYQKRVFLIRAK